MEELRKKLKTKKQGPKQIDIMEVVDKPSQAKKGKRVKSIKEINKSVEEDKQTRKLFETLLDKDEDVIRSSILRFAYGKATKSTLENVVNKLPAELYSDFITTYLDQTDKNIEDFYESYINKPLVKTAINKKLEEADKEYDEKKRLKDINLALFGDISSDSDEEITLEYKPKKSKKKEQLSELDEIDVEEEPFFEDILQSSSSKVTPKKRKVKIVEFGEGGEMIEVKSPKKLEPKEEAQPYYDIKCITDRNNVPWIKEPVLKTYIAQVNDENPIDRYVSDTKKMREEQGDVWYPANKAFTLLMCNNNSSSRSQKGQVHTAFTNDGKRVDIMVGYETNKGFIVQDESIFNAEKQYEKEQMLSTRQKLEIVLEEPIDSKIEEIGVYTLSSLLHSIAPTVSDYGIYKQDYTKRDTSYILKAVETISNSTKTKREFLNKLAGVVVYLSPRIEKLGSSVFKKRVQEEYYLPEILVNLSPSEKLPEVFENPRTTEKATEYATRLIEEETGLFMLDSIYTLYSEGKISMRRKSVIYRPLFEVTAQPKIEKWKSICVNKKDVDGIPDEQTVYYSEDDDVYCLVIDEIIEQILNDKVPVNPVTNKKLNKEFIKRFTDVYSRRITEYTKEQKEVEQPKPSTPLKVEKEIAPGLLDMIIDNIKTCEEEERDDEDINEDNKCKGLDNPPKKRDKKEKVEEEVEEVEESGFSPSIQEVDMCEYCKEGVDIDKCLKTKVKDGNDFKTIHFCCFNCFEKYDTWPKKDKQASGKKGGRKGTKERNKKGKK
jgi:hypothetical protein